MIGVTENKTELMIRKYSETKEYEEHINMLYRHETMLVVKGYGISAKGLTDEKLDELVKQARHLSKTTVFTMTKSVEQTIKPLKFRKVLPNRIKG
jgi:hypothetical protein